MEAEFAKWLLSAAGGGLAATWGMLRWTNGRIRRLELDRVTPADCSAHIIAISKSDEAMWRDIKDVREAVARIEGHLGTK